MVARHQMRAPIKDIRLHYENFVITYIFLLEQAFQESQKTLPRAWCTEINVFLMRTEIILGLLYIMDSLPILYLHLSTLHNAIISVGKCLDKVQVCFWFIQHIQDTTVCCCFKTGKCQTRALYFTHFPKCHFNSKK